MKKNDMIQVKIEDRLFPNKGIASYEGQKVMIKDTLPQQTVQARVTKRKNGVIEARLLDIVEPSCLQTKTPCRHFDNCGGCTYQQLGYEQENNLKQQQVLALFEKAGITNFQYEGIISSPVQEGYRNKCEFSFGDEQKGGELSLGMRKRHSYYEVVTLQDCNIVDGDYLKILHETLQFFREEKIPFYHKMTHEGQLRHLVVRKGAYTGEILLNLITVSSISFCVQHWAQRMLDLKLDGTICGILHTKNDSVADVVKSDETKALYGRDYYTDKLLGLTFEVGAFSFFQTNTKGAESLYCIVRDFVGDALGKVLFDLYCGTGTISQIMAQKCDRVYGIELVEQAIEAAKKNAQRNGISNCAFYAGDVLKKVDELTEKPDIIILDPPREGIHPKAIEKIIAFDAPQIVYVSCKPTSLVRDLQVFVQRGYQVERVKLVNQFPRTVHVESVVLLQRK